MTNIYSKKCKIVFWPVFALAVLSAASTSSHPSEPGGGSEGRVNARVLSVALHAEIDVIGDPRALKKSSIRKGSWSNFFWSVLRELVIHSSFLFQGAPSFPVFSSWSLRALLAFWFLYVSFISSGTRQIFSLPLHSPQLILFSVQQLKIS